MSSFYDGKCVSGCIKQVLLYIIWQEIRLTLKVPELFQITAEEFLLLKTTKFMDDIRPSLDLQCLTSGGDLNK